MTDTAAARPLLLALRHLVTLAGAGVTLLLLLLTVSARPVHGDSLDQQAREIGLGLRCPVCQNVSVADSTSELAGQMRQVIREQLEQGKTKAEITAYFLERYGESVLFEPPKQGFALLAWIVAPLGLLAGAAVLWRLLRRRRPHITLMSLPAHVSAGAAGAAPAARVLDLAAYRARLRADLDELDDTPTLPTASPPLARRTARIRGRP